MTFGRNCADRGSKDCWLVTGLSVRRSGTTGTDEVVACGEVGKDDDDDIDESGGKGDESESADPLASEVSRRTGSFVLPARLVSVTRLTSSAYS